MQLQTRAEKGLRGPNFRLDMEEITLDSLIREHELRIDNLKYKPNPPHCFGFAYYY